MFWTKSYEVLTITLILLSLIVLYLIKWNHIPLDLPSCGCNLSHSLCILATGNGTATHAKYVSLCRARLTRYQRTGNHLFMLASMLHVARVTGRTLVMPRTGWYLDQIFQLYIPRYDDLKKQICPCQDSDLLHYDYDQRFDDPKFVESLWRTNESQLVCGLSQPYRYAEQNEMNYADFFDFWKTFPRRQFAISLHFHSVNPNCGSRTSRRLS